MLCNSQLLLKNPVHGTILLVIYSISKSMPCHTPYVIIGLFFCSKWITYFMSKPFMNSALIFKTLTEGNLANCLKSPGCNMTDSFIREYEAAADHLIITKPYTPLAKVECSTANRKTRGLCSKVAQKNLPIIK